MKSFFFFKGILVLIKICITNVGQVIYISFFFFNYYLFLAVLGLRFCARAFSSCGERGPLLIKVRRPLTIAASLVAEHRLQTRRLSSCGSRAACGILPDQGSNLCPLHRQADSQPRAPPGKPMKSFLQDS